MRRWARWIAGWCIGTIAAALAADTLSAPYTPPADVSGSWSFKADPALPNVLLLGDSISIGYTRAVRSLLTGKANVYRASNADGSKPANCGDSRMGLAGLERWLGTRHWDVIHFNWGLWDLCYRNPAAKTQGNRDKIGGKLPFPPEEYVRNLEKIVTRLEATGAKLIWASTTVVPSDEAGRNVGDEVRYNRMAAEVMTRHHIPIDDLYMVTAKLPKAESAAPGDVHYTAAGYGKIAEQVARVVTAALPAPLRAPVAP
jgi:hypothetical protein